MMNRRILITGVGAVSGLGIGADHFWDRLKAGKSAIQSLDPPIEDTKISLGARIPDYDPDHHFSPDELSLLDRFSQLAVIAAREAINDAGLEDNGAVIESAAAIIGSGCGGKHTDEDTYDQLYRQQKSRLHPLTIPRGMPSAAACMVSMLLGIRGPSFATASACASGSHAIIQGCMMIQASMADVVLVGASDAPFTLGLL